MESWTSTDRHHPSKRRLDLLVTPGFVAALALLLANDLVLKARYGNWITGKLSDLAGLFALALFVSAFFPHRRAAVHVGTALVFAWWKSPLSSAVLWHWNSLGLWPLERVIDYSDWLALAILPIAWWYSSEAAAVRWLRPARPLLVLAAILAFAATTAPRERTPDGTMYVLALPRAQVLDSVLANHESPRLVRASGKGVGADTIEVAVLYDTYVILELRTATTGETVVTFLEADRTTNSPSLEEIRRFLQDSIIRPLQAVASAPTPAG